MYKKILPTGQRGPLRVMFLITSMPIGGAETLLVNLVRGMDENLFAPQIGCLKERGVLGEELKNEFPVHCDLIHGKYDVKILGRLHRLFVQQQIDAVITVGAGDKMFWGRLAAKRARIPVILSALHSTGWPDGVGRLNKMLTPITDSFIAVAREHGRHLVTQERFPERKVCVIPNGIDTERFRKDIDAKVRLRNELGIPLGAPVCGIVAALRPEKNHLLFLRAAKLLNKSRPDAHFVIVGDGEERPKIETAISDADLSQHFHCLGSRNDIPQLLSMMDIFTLTSHNEASPVSILEAMSTELPIVATNVGSISETVQHGKTGFLTRPGSAEMTSEYWGILISDQRKMQQFGKLGRSVVVERASLQVMIEGYQNLIEKIYLSKCPTIEIPEIVTLATSHIDQSLPQR